MYVFIDTATWRAEVRFETEVLPPTPKGVCTDVRLVVGRDLERCAVTWSVRPEHKEGLAAAFRALADELEKA